MLKTNTVLTFLTTALVGLLCWIGKGVWDDVAVIKATSITTTTEVKNLQDQVDDHEKRIRQTEHDVTILQQQHDDRRAISPKLKENENP